MSSLSQRDERLFEQAVAIRSEDQVCAVGHQARFSKGDLLAARGGWAKAQKRQNQLHLEIPCTGMLAKGKLEICEARSGVDVATGLLDVGDEHGERRW